MKAKVLKSWSIALSLHWHKKRNQGLVLQKGPSVKAAVVASCHAGIAAKTLPASEIPTASSTSISSIGLSHVDGAEQLEKQARKLQATLVRNYDPLAR